MNKVYINSVASISAQKTFDNSVFLDEIIDYNANVLTVVDPDYKDFIPPAAARRMAKGIKMGVVASKIALAEAGLDNVDAIITGTGLGCTVDSEKFVSALIDNNEEYLTPTSFIQSTHNTVGGQIALGIGCKGYNFTYVHASVSFETALMDAQMQLANDEARNILIGGVDETGGHTIKIHKLIGHIKQDDVASATLLKTKTKGAVFSEGANFFVLSNEPSNSCYAELVDVAMVNTLSMDQVAEATRAFLKANGFAIEDIDAVVLGINGDSDFDTYYDTLESGIFKNTQQLYYKHLCGEFYTASSFGVWLAAKIVKLQVIPEVVKHNTISASGLNRILLYNQYRGENHSFTLLQQC